MARPKKDDKPEEPAAAGPTTISVDEFRKTRDSVIQGLTGLQLAVGNLLSAYMAHCNSILGEGNPDSLDAHDLNRLTGAFAAGATAEVLAPVETKKEKKKRAKKERDPDMPKRPLTAAFLYGQTARPIIKKDLEEALPAGEKLSANAVNEEVNKRWNNMSEDEKQLWRNAYQENMVKYKQQMEEYAAKKGTTLAEVQTLAEDETADVVAGPTTGVAEASEEDSDKEPTPPPKAPTPPPAAKSNKRRKTAKENGVTGSVAATQSPVPAPSATKKKAPAAKKKDAAPEKDASPEEPKKKRARKSRGGDEAEAPEAAPEGEKKERKRKRKSEAA